MWYLAFWQLFTIVYNIYNHLQPFTTIYNTMYNHEQQLTTIYNHLQPFTTKKQNAVHGRRAEEDALVAWTEKRVMMMHIVHSVQQQRHESVQPNGDR